MGCRQVYAVLCPGVVTLRHGKRNDSIDYREWSTQNYNWSTATKSSPYQHRSSALLPRRREVRLWGRVRGTRVEICPSLRWNERVFSSSLSRSLVAAPDIFSQSRIHWPGEIVNEKQKQSLLHFGKNSGKIVLQRWQAACFSFDEGRDQWLLTLWPTKRKSGSDCLLQTCIIVTITVAPRRLYTVCWHVFTWSRKKSDSYVTTVTTLWLRGIIPARFRPDQAGPGSFDRINHTRWEKTRQCVRHLFHTGNLDRFLK